MKQSKYRNKKIATDEGVFDSKAEYKRWQELNLMQKAGLITELDRQVPFVLAPGVVINGRKRPPMKYIADFVYHDENGNKVVEDVKGHLTDAYKIKRHLMMSAHNQSINEIYLKRS